MKRFSSLSLLFILLSLLLVPSYAFAQKIPVTVLHGVFTNEKGESVQFRVADGGYVSIKNPSEGLYYTLGARVLKGDQVELTLRHFGDHDQKALWGTDVLEVTIGEGTHKSPLAPFSIALTGKTEESAKVRRVSRSDAAVPNAIACCIECGPWIICCGVSVEAVRAQEIIVGCCGIETACATCVVCEGVIVD